jgi:fimV C-terminal domain
MKIILILIAIILIAVGGWFIVQHLQSRRHTQPRLADANKSLKVKRAEPAIYTLPEQPDPLSSVDVYLHNQDYTSAVSELKRILMTNPRHMAAMLKLLQVYGVTKQYGAFNQLHQKIHQIADQKTIQEADFCKSLIDEEMVSLQTQTAAKPEANQAQTAKQDKIDIETLEFVTEEKPIQKPTTPSKSSAITDEEPILDFSLDFDEQPSQPTQSVQTSTSKNNEPQMLLDLDLSFDNTQSPTPKTQKPAASTKDDIDLLPLDNTTSKNEFSVEPNKPTFDTPNLDLTTTTPKQPTLENSLEAEFDFNDLNLDLETDKPAKIAKSSDTLTEFDSLSLSSDSKIKTEVELKKEQTTFDFSGLSLETTEATTETTSHQTLVPIKELEAQKPQIKSDDNKNDSEEGFDFTFALDFDKPKLDIAETDVKTKDLVQNQEDTSKTHHNDKPQNTFNDLSIDFDFDEKDLQTSTIKADNSFTANNQNAVKKDASINFEMPIIEVTPVRVETQIDENLDNIDFANDSALQQTQTTAVEPLTVEPVAQEINHNTDDTTNDLLFNDDKLASKPNDEFSFNSLSFDSVTADKSLEIPIEISITPETDVLAAVQSETPIIEVPVEIVKTAEEDKITVSETITEKEVEKQPEESTLAPFGTETADNIGDLDNITDGVEITLQLAKQYLQFGEYDSAKRLLTEVINDGNLEQKTSAEGLIINLT